MKQEAKLFDKSYLSYTIEKGTPFINLEEVQVQGGHKSINFAYKSIFNDFDLESDQAKLEKYGIVNTLADSPYTHIFKNDLLDYSDIFNQSGA